VADTLGLPIGGGADFPKVPAELEAQLVSQRDVSQERAARLVDLYGTLADAVLAFCAGRSDDTPLDDGTTLTSAELVYLITHEHVADLADLVLRRLPLAITGAVSAERIAAIAATAAAELGWDEAATAAQVGKLTDELQTYHGVSADMLAQRNQAGR
jgi:glycerol-3-phosphate dehydrogenase